MTTRPIPALRSHRRLQALWTRHLITGGLDADPASAPVAERAWRDPDEFIRAWTLQLCLEDRHIAEPHMQELRRLAQSDPSPVVRLYIASALQRRPSDAAWPLLESPASLTLRTVTEERTLPRSDIAEQSTGESSLMPEGLLEALGDRERLELLKFLTTK